LINKVIGKTNSTIANCKSIFEWYLDLRRYGSVPHAGFGLGLERTVGWICGFEHLRKTIPFARMIYRNTP